MGCASSAPLVEQGKHLVEGVKDTANDTMAKGEKALHGEWWSWVTLRTISNSTDQGTTRGRQQTKGAPLADVPLHGV
ncbi:hypothetical protein HUJ05_008980 [Dendroctonus ponderosae]|nr:hypothetical protein HUJ05_008980 [Dendroctonus ponderosae]